MAATSSRRTTQNVAFSYMTYIRDSGPRLVREDFCSHFTGPLTVPGFISKTNSTTRSPYFERTLPRKKWNAYPDLHRFFAEARRNVYSAAWPETAPST